MYAFATDTAHLLGDFSRTELEGRVFVIISLICVCKYYLLKLLNRLIMEPTLNGQFRKVVG